MNISDNELIGLFVKSSCENAFEDLLRRHSKMVWHVCQSILWRREDIEDAFQSTFLVLARKAPKLIDHECLAGWIHETAYRSSCDIRKTALRKSGESLAKTGETDIQPWQEISNAHEHEVLHLEISKLPKRYREVIVLCHLEGLSRSEAADHLNCTTASVKAALARGRKLLRKRLIRHGFAATILLASSQFAIRAAAAASDTGPSVLAQAIDRCIDDVFQQAARLEGNSVLSSLQACRQSFFSTNGQLTLVASVIVLAGLIFGLSIPVNSQASLQNERLVSVAQTEPATSPVFRAEKNSALNQTNQPSAPQELGADKKILAATKLMIGEWRFNWRKSVNEAIASNANQVELGLLRHREKMRERAMMKFGKDGKLVVLGNGEKNGDGKEKETRLVAKWRIHSVEPGKQKRIVVEMQVPGGIYRNGEFVPDGTVETAKMTFVIQNRNQLQMVIGENGEKGYYVLERLKN